MKTKKDAPKATKPAYKASSHEALLLREYLARSANGSVPKLKVLDEKGLPKISPDHPVEIVGYLLLMEALGTMDGDFANGLISQLANVGSQGSQIDEGGAQFHAFRRKGHQAERSD